MGKITMDSLRRYNLIAGCLHLTQGIAVLILSKEFLLPISGSFLRFNQASQSLEPATTILFNLSLPLLIAIFFFLSAAAHFSIVTFYRNQYVKLLAKGINKARWIEYALSASIMIVAISLLVGVYDFMSLVMLFSLAAIMNLMGLVMEIHNQTTKKNQLAELLDRLPGRSNPVGRYCILLVAWCRSRQQCADVRLLDICLDLHLL